MAFRLGDAQAQSCAGDFIGLQVAEPQVDGGADHPNIYTAAPGMDGDPPVWPGSVVVTDPEDARRQVRRLEFAAPQYVGIDGQDDDGASHHRLPFLGHR